MSMAVFQKMSLQNQQHTGIDLWIMVGQPMEATGRSANDFWEHNQVSYWNVPSQTQEVRISDSGCQRWNLKTNN